MAEYKRPRRFFKTAVATAFGVVLFDTACETPQPLGVEPVEPDALVAGVAQAKSPLLLLDSSLGLPAPNSDGVRVLTREGRAYYQAQWKEMVPVIRQDGSATASFGTLRLNPTRRDSLNTFKLREMDAQTVGTLHFEIGATFRLR